MFMSTTACDQSSSSSSFISTTSPSASMTLTPIQFAQQQQSSMTTCWRRRRRLLAYLADQGWNLRPTPNSAAAAVIFRSSNLKMDLEPALLSAGSAEDTEEVVWCGDRANVAVSTSPHFEVALKSNKSSSFQRKPQTKSRMSRREKIETLIQVKRASTANSTRPMTTMMNRLEELNLKSKKTPEHIQPNLRPSWSWSNLSSFSNVTSSSLRTINPCSRQLGLAMEGASIIAGPKVANNPQARTRSGCDRSTDGSLSQRTFSSVGRPKGRYDCRSNHRPASFVNLNLDMRRERAQSDDDERSSCISWEDSVSDLEKPALVFGEDCSGPSWNASTRNLSANSSIVSSGSSDPPSASLSNVSLLPISVVTTKSDRVISNKVMCSTEPSLVSTQRQRALHQSNNAKPESAGSRKMGGEPTVSNNSKKVQVGLPGHRRTGNYDRRGQPIVTLVSLTSTSPEPAEKNGKEQPELI